MPFGIPNTPSSPTAEQSSQSNPDQRDFDALVAGYNETFVTSGCAVTANNNLLPSVAAGTAVVAGARVTVSGGTVTITTADATNPRIDAVVVDNTGAKSVIAGTPAAAFGSSTPGPVVPSLAGKCLLAFVYVAATTTSIATADIVDKRILVESDPSLSKNWDAPTGVTIQNYPRGQVVNAAALTTQTMKLTGVWYPKGFVVTTLWFVSGTTALVTGTHGWACLYDASLNKLRQSTDDTSVAWAANTLKGFTLSSTFTITAAGFYYHGLLIAATTVPSMGTITASATTGNAVPPIICGNSSTGLNTGTAPDPAAAISAAAAAIIWTGAA